MDTAISRERLAPDEYRDTTELSDSQTEAEIKVLPTRMAGIELEKVPKCFAKHAERTEPVVGILYI
jgi:hypothetical protein